MAEQKLTAADGKTELFSIVGGGLGVSAVEFNTIYSELVASKQQESNLAKKLEAEQESFKIERAAHIETLRKAEAAEARIKASQEQEPALFGFLDTTTNSYYGLSNRGGAGQIAFYLAPVITPDVMELQRRNNEQFAAMLDLATARDRLQRDNTELTRKLAEQQALFSKLTMMAWPNGNKEFLGEAGFEELTKLLAEAKNKVVPDWKSIIIDRLHSKVGLCMTCGIHRCKHGSNTMLPDTVQIDDVLWCINLDEHFFKEAPQPPKEQLLDLQPLTNSPFLPPEDV